MIKTFKTFFGFVTRNKLAYTLVLVAVVITAVLQSITPYFFKLFVDNIPLLNFNDLLRILVIFVGVSILALITDVISGVIGDIILTRSAREAREEIFAHVQDLDFTFHSGKSTGGLISIFKRGDGAFFELFQQIHFNLLNTFVTTAVMVFFFTRLNLTISVLMIVSLTISIVSTILLVKNNLKKREVFNDDEDHVSGVIGDNISNYETVKLFAREKWETSRLSNSFLAWTKSLWGYANSFRLFDIVIGTITNTSIFLTLLFSLYLTTTGKINIGDFVMIIGFIGIFFPKINNLVWSTRNIAKSYADIERYLHLLNYQIEVLDPENPIVKDHVEGNIKFDNLSFTYNGRTKNAISSISFDIKKGESVALVGRSGSGKTTLSKLLMRFYDLSSGRIMIDGTNIKDFTKSDLRSFVGVVPQEPILFNNTIAYNIGYGKDNPTMAEIRSAAKVANIDGFIEGLKDKYNTEVGERGVKLSGGQKQRIAIARMILSDPDIVVFDEATSHLDSESEKLIQDAFWKARKDKTTIIIAHRLSTVMRADKIVVMEHGKIKEIGTHEELLKNKTSLYSHFWNLQIKLD